MPTGHPAYLGPTLAPYRGFRAKGLIVWPGLERGGGDESWKPVRRPLADAKPYSQYVNMPWIL